MIVYIKPVEYFGFEKDTKLPKIKFQGKKVQCSERFYDVINKLCC